VNLVDRVLTTFRRRVVLLARPLEAPSAPHAPPDPAVRVALLDTSDLDAYAALRRDRPRDEASQRLAAGQRCFAVWYDGRLAHTIWSASGEVRVAYLHATLVLGPEDVYHYDSFTRAEMRRKGLTHVRTVFAWEHDAALGARRVLGLSAIENQAGVASMRAKGFRDVAHIELLRLGPWKRLRRTPLTDAPLPRVVPD